MHGSVGRISAVLCAMVAAAVAVFASDRFAGGGVQITVTTDVDSYVVDGFCSLREAVVAASFGIQVDTCPGQAGGARHTITLSPPGPYVLTLGASGEDAGLEGDLDVYAPITIRTNNGLPRIIDGNQNDRILHIHDPVLVELRDVVLQNGRLASGSGAGIYSEGLGTDLDLEDVELRNNVAEVGSGGGIFMIQGGTLFLSRTVFADNRAGTFGGGFATTGLVNVVGSVLSIEGNEAGLAGGGIGHHSDGSLELADSAVIGNGPPEVRLGGTMDGGGIELEFGSMTLENVTLSGNVAEDFGGGLGIGPNITATLKSVTVTNNVASSGGGIQGSFGPSTVTLQNSIVADNATTFQAPDCFGTLESDGHNLLGDSTECTLADCGQPECGDVVDVSPLLTALGDHGGPTKTHLLLAGSPAIDAGDPSPVNTGGTSCPLVDQRLELRPFDGDGDLNPRCDMGAVEMQQMLLPIFVDGFESGDTSAWSMVVGL